MCNKTAKNKWKQEAHKLVINLPRRDKVYVVVDGYVGKKGKWNRRRVIQVTLTARTERGVLQAPGISYLNPGEYDGKKDKFAFDQGVKIARGEAELSLGLQMLMLEGASLGVAEIHEKQIINAMHRLPSERRKWTPKK